MNNHRPVLNYGLELARIIASRSEDPYRKVGAIIFDEDNRVLATGYNGLASGFTPENPNDFWLDKEGRKPFMIHAEINALSSIKRNEGKILICTLKPCLNCLKACIAHGIKEIYYEEEKEGLEDSTIIANKYAITLHKLR